MREHGRGQGGGKLITVGRVMVAIAAIFFGVEHFLHTANVPGVPLEKLMPAWIPAHALIGYLTGVILFVAGWHPGRKKNADGGNVSRRWLVLVVFFIYGPILIAALGDPSTELRSKGSIISSTRCCLLERFSRSPARLRAPIN